MLTVGGLEGGCGDLEMTQKRPASLDSAKGCPSRVEVQATV